MRQGRARAHELDEPGSARGRVLQLPESLGAVLHGGVDAAVYAFFELSEADVIEAERGFWGPRFTQEFPRLTQERQTGRVA